MRLAPSDIQRIKSSIEKYVSSYTLYLYGSRVDDELKGGDIDLFLVVSEEDVLHLKSKKHYLEAELSLQMDDQRIDLTILSEQEKNGDHFFRHAKKIEL